ncbi:MAG: hypothetical protein ACRC0A_01670 [Chitinophagaceae bacterium]
MDNILNNVYRVVEWYIGTLLSVIAILIVYFIIGTIVVCLITLWYYMNIGIGSNII